MTARLTNTEKAERKRERLRLEILDKAADVLGRISKPHTEKRVLTSGDLAGTIITIEHELPTAGSVRDYCVSFGILLDKYRLEMGEITDRTRSEHHVTQVSEEQLERDIRRIAGVADIRSKRKQRAS